MAMRRLRSSSDSTSGGARNAGVEHLERRPGDAIVRPGYSRTSEPGRPPVITRKQCRRFSSTRSNTKGNRIIRRCPVDNGKHVDCPSAAEDESGLHAVAGTRTAGFADPRLVRIFGSDADYTAAAGGGFAILRWCFNEPGPPRVLGPPHRVAEVGDLERHLCDTLEGSGLLENDAYLQMKEEKHRAFAESPHREPAHAGSAYPDELDALQDTMRRYLGTDRASADGLTGIAAPHVSPEGGWLSYRSAYAALSPLYADRTFVVLGTSHYGEPDKFGLTRKPYRTPYGEAVVDHARIDWLAQHAHRAILMEDYCHSIEHSIEFQVLFLQSIYGPQVKVLPILCGSYARSIYQGGMPEDNQDVRRFLEALGEIADRDRGDLLWVLGIDMAHIGRRTATRIRGRRRGPDDRRGATRFPQNSAHRRRRRGWLLEPGTGAPRRSEVVRLSPLYTFLRCVPGVKGELQRYEQWNIDEQSVVSFAGMTFHPGG